MKAARTSTIGDDGSRRPESLTRSLITANHHAPTAMARMPDEMAEERWEGAEDEEARCDMRVRGKLT